MKLLRLVAMGDRRSAVGEPNSKRPGEETRHPRQGGSTGMVVFSVMLL